MFLYTPGPAMHNEMYVQVGHYLRASDMYFE